MKKGQSIRRYVITTEPRAVNGAHSEWAQCTAEGKVYFIKRFLAPTWPSDSAPGSEEKKKRRRAVASAFESRHKGITERLRSRMDGSGNLVITLDFFRHEGQYYKVTEFVQPAAIKPLKDVPGSTGLVVVRTLALSLSVLHRAGLVHGDLKPGNALVCEVSKGVFVTKLIDFDNGYYARKPPPRQEISGDQAYFSPELLLYLLDDDATDPTELDTPSDIFSLGLWLHWVTTGRLPGFPASYPGAASAAQAGVDLTVSPTGRLGRLIAECLQRTPRARPDIERVVEVLTDMTPDEFTADARGTSPTAPVATPPATGWGSGSRPTATTGSRPPRRTAATGAPDKRLRTTGTAPAGGGAGAPSGPKFPRRRATRPVSPPGKGLRSTFGDDK